MPQPFVRVVSHAPVATYPACGSDPGYQRHRALRQQPCPRCCAAHAPLDSRDLRRAT